MTRLLLAAAVSVLGAASAVGQGDTAVLELTLRSRAAAPGEKPAAPAERKATWEAAKTAIVVCDMWDDHWCKSAAARVNELAGPLNDTLKAARAKGVFVIHAPSTCTAFYKDTPQRRLAQAAPFAKAPRPLADSPRWGTAWSWPDARREGVLPIDDTDMGCDCRAKCEIRSPWTRQTSAIEVAAGDAVTDDGQEVWNLLRQRGIDRVLICGVHLNMCVLGRPFAIRELVKLGVTVALVRDLTDTMYNPDRPPGGTHFDGTDRVVEHVERYWCPSLVSSDLTGKPAFRFRGDDRKAAR